MHRCDSRRAAERLARYATRVVVATGKVRRLEGGRVRIETPSDARTGRTWLELDEIEFVHALCQQVPARGMHLVRYVGVYANRLRKVYREARARLADEDLSEDLPEDLSAALAGPVPGNVEEGALPAPPGSAEALRRQAWARMLRKVFEVEPLVCPRCRQEGRRAVRDLLGREGLGRLLVFRRDRRHGAEQAQQAE